MIILIMIILIILVMIILIILVMIILTRSARVMEATLATLCGIVDKSCLLIGLVISPHFSSKFVFQSCKCASYVNLTNPGTASPANARLAQRTGHWQRALSSKAQLSPMLQPTCWGTRTSTARPWTPKTSFCATESKPSWVEAECPPPLLSLVTEFDYRRTICGDLTHSISWAGLPSSNISGLSTPTEDLLGELLGCLSITSLLS